MDQTSSYNSNHINLEELQRQWKSMEVRIDDLEHRNRVLATRLKDNSVCGLRQKLMNFRKRNIILCCLLPVFLCPAVVSTLDASVWFLGVYCLFFYFMGFVNWIIYRKLSRIDLSEATTEQALVFVYDVKRYVRYGRLAGWAFAAPVLVWIFSIFYEIGDPAIIWGGWAGLLIGLAIGFCADYRQRKLLRQLRLEIELSDTDAN